MSEKMSNEELGHRRKSARILALEEKEKEKRKSCATNANNTNNIGSSRGKASLTGNVQSFQYQHLPHRSASMQPSSLSPLKRGRKQKRLEDLAVPYLDQSESQQDGEDSKDKNLSTRTGQQLTGLPSIPEGRILGIALDILQRRDTLGIFAQPVNPEEVEAYYLIIKEPMDFGAMRNKLKEGKYTSIEQFERDVFLVSSNAMHFNSSTTIYYKEARAMQGLAEAVLYTLKTNPEKLESEFSLTRGHPVSGRKSPRVSKKRGSRSRPRLTGVKMGASPRGPRRDTDSAVPKRESPQFYRPQASFCSENEKLVSSVYNAEKMLTENEEKGDHAYKQSLLRFVKGLGPTAKKVAAMKLIKCLPQARTSSHSGQRLLLPAPSFTQTSAIYNAQFPITSLHSSTGSSSILHGRNTFLNLNIQASPNDLMPPPKQPMFSQTPHNHLLRKVPMPDNNVAYTNGSSSRENRTYPSDNMATNLQGSTYLGQKAVVPQQEVVDNQKDRFWLASHLKVIPVEDANSPNGKKFVTVDMMADNHPDTDELSANWKSRLRGFVHRGNTFLQSFNLFPNPSESSGSSSSARGMVNNSDHWQYPMNSNYSNSTAQTGQSSEGFGIDSDFATLQKLLTHEYTPLPSYDELGVVHERAGNNAGRHGQVGINQNIEREPNLSLQL